MSRNKPTTRRIRFNTGISGARYNYNPGDVVEWGNLAEAQRFIDAGLASPADNDRLVHHGKIVPEPDEIDDDDDFDDSDDDGEQISPEKAVAPRVDVERADAIKPTGRGSGRGRGRNGN